MNFQSFTFKNHGLYFRSFYEEKKIFVIKMLRFYRQKVLIYFVSRFRHLRTRRVLLLYKVYGNNALLALNWQIYILGSDCDFSSWYAAFCMKHEICYNYKGHSWSSFQHWLSMSYTNPPAVWKFDNSYVYSVVIFSHRYLHSDCISFKTFVFLAVYWSIWTSSYNIDIKVELFLKWSLHNVKQCI